MKKALKKHHLIIKSDKLQIGRLFALRLNDSDKWIKTYLYFHIEISENLKITQSHD